MSTSTIAASEALLANSIITQTKSPEADMILMKNKFNYGFQIKHQWEGKKTAHQLTPPWHMKHSIINTISLLLHVN
jgi:hypothetical protein